MKVYSAWDNSARTILHIVHERDWTWSELHRHDETVLPQMMADITHPIGVIVDMLQSPYFPAESFAQHIQRSSAVYTRYDIDGVVFVIRESDIGELLLSAHRRFGTPGRLYCVAGSLEEARAILAQRDGV